MLDGLTNEESFELAQRAMRADAAGSGLPDPVAVGISAVRARRAGWAHQGPISDVASGSLMA